MLNLQDIDAFSDSGSPKTVGTDWTDGEWIPRVDNDLIVTFSYVLSETLPDTLDAKVHISPDHGVTDRGPIHQVDYVTAGKTGVSDLVLSLSVADTNPHTFEVLVRGGYHWRLYLRKTGAGTSKALVVADCTRVDYSV